MGILKNCVRVGRVFCWQWWCHSEQFFCPPESEMRPPSRNRGKHDLPLSYTEREQILREPGIWSSREEANGQNEYTRKWTQVSTSRKSEDPNLISLEQALGVRRELKLKEAEIRDNNVLQTTSETQNNSGATTTISASNKQITVSAVKTLNTTTEIPEDAKNSTSKDDG